MNVYVWVEFLSRLICMFSTLAVLIAVAVDFMRFYGRRPKEEKRSIVATATMVGFFIVVYLVIVFRVGEFKVAPWIDGLLDIIGAFLLGIGAYVNIRGRVDLGKQWSDHIRIYEDHRIVSEGVYSLVRHPLYASLIWMFFGSAMLYLNWPVFLLNAFVFVPAIYFRARQEERMLVERFSEYDEYRKNVPMFFPVHLKGRGRV